MLLVWCTSFFNAEKFTCWLTFFFGYGNDYFPQRFTGPKSDKTTWGKKSLEGNTNWQLLRLLIKEAEMINSIGEARYLDVYFWTRLGSNGQTPFFLGGEAFFLGGNMEDNFWRFEKTVVFVKDVLFCFYSCLFPNCATFPPFKDFQIW